MKSASDLAVFIHPQTASCGRILKLIEELDTPLHPPSHERDGVWARAAVSEAVEWSGNDAFGAQ